MYDSKIVEYSMTCGKDNTCIYNPPPPKKKKLIVCRSCINSLHIILFLFGMRVCVWREGGCEYLILSAWLVDWYFAFFFLEKLLNRDFDEYTDSVASTINDMFNEMAWHDTKVHL